MCTAIALQYAQHDGLIYIYFEMIFTIGSANMHYLMRAKSLQSCPTVGDPVDCSPPGSSLHGISHAVLERVMMPSSRGSS